MAELTDEIVIADRETAKQYAQLEGVEYVDPHPDYVLGKGPQTVIAEPPTDKYADIPNEKLLELLNQRTGLGLTDITSIKAPEKPAEEIAKENEERSSKMLTYGLTSGKFKKEDYDAFQQANANKLGMIKSEIRSQFATAFPDLSPEDLDEKVAHYCFEHLDPSDAMRVAREKELLHIADSNINTRYANIVNLPADYDKYEEGMNNNANFERKIQATLPVYTSDVDRALEALRKFTVPVPDSKNPKNTVEVPLEYSDTDLKEMRDLLLDRKQVERAVKEGLTFEQIVGEADMVLWNKHKGRFIAQAAKQYHATQRDNYLQARKGLNSNAADAIEIHNDGIEGNDAVYDKFEI